MKTEDQIRDLIQRGESQNVEFKVKYDSDKVGQAICALANDWPQTGDGTLLIGIDDKTKEAAGLSENLNALQQSVASLCRSAVSPNMAPLIYVLELDKSVIVVETQICRERPYRFKNTCFIRVGTTTRQATFQEELLLSERATAMQKLGRFQGLTFGQSISDVPPANARWVGRTRELASLSYPGFKVVFITGMGGQGKSGLASHFVTNVVQSGSEYEYWDWRDLNEEENRLHGKLISTIDRLLLAVGAQTLQLGEIANWFGPFPLGYSSPSTPTSRRASRLSAVNLGRSEYLSATEPP